MKTIGADESDAAFALTFLLASLVNISLPVKLLKRGIHLNEFLFQWYWGVKL